MKSVLKIKETSGRILYLALIVPLLIAILAQFNFIDVSKFAVGALTLIAAFFIMNEIRGRNLKKDIIALMGMIFSVTAILLTLVIWLNLNIAWVTTIQGVVNAFIVFYVIVEALR